MMARRKKHPPPERVFIYWCEADGELLDTTTCAHQADDWKSFDNCNRVYEYRRARRQ